MTLAAALLPLLPGGRGVVALVGAGGKTSALFRLGQEWAEQGARVLLTSTTHLLDPRLEPGRPELELILRPDLEFPASPEPLPEARSGLSLLMAREAAPGKLKGLAPGWVPALAARWDFVLVEADGAKRLPLKAPGAQEPVLPAGPALVLGVLGLDALGQPLDERHVHRPERFAELTGCALGQPVTWAHLAALVRHPQGLFKGAAGARVLLLNKLEVLEAGPEPELLAGLPVDRVVLGSLRSADPVKVFQRGTMR